MKSIGEKCAVFGIYGKGLDVSRLTFFGLYALQHRGQESSGIASTDGKEIFCHKNAGLVAQVFNEETIKGLPGHIAVGHNRYSTSSGSGIKHAQPVEVEDKSIVLAHNGNLPSVIQLASFLKSRGVVLSNVSDSAMITGALHVLVKEGMEIEKAVEEIFPLMTGSFSILIMTKEKLIALRDSFGIRPLSIARLNGGYVFASETCAFHPIGATYMREVNPGEMVVVDENGLKIKQIAERTQKLDIFEFVYFSRPDSNLLGKSVYGVRKNFGIQLAKEYKINADVVIPVPETAIPVAVGYANASGIPFEMGLIKSRYIHRTFIEPEQHIRDQGVKLKLAPLKEIIENKRVIVIDDSIVRGTTSRQIVKMLFEVGAKEVHFLVSSPPVKFPDFYGIDLPNQGELLAANKTIEEINTHLGSTSLRYLSYEGMIKSTGLDESLFCTSCFTGQYPVDLRERKREVVYLNQAHKAHRYGKI
ncbi:MAG: amidophosphoribosyltransferase [Candidatus Yanofskybacteria bacterium CG10_big_fil_rev_8_21_14_0_10_46_23]|uniref:Amidophosphoribosyltransferase n=1 Tax=Candidatus Yanofskybacteria bacterium CG10_big_fil_rev_8_21_14_0_10_46_23 TaxID=1975098 RepID=A0A2H0R3T0_9BACT|nr:MAG: amidophosphoribosyltransferase [Candidatus Yanofskybacteria bacterium CG10_big_fil_rev_8_21_14_0_10_46_23]